jgi:riboflavin synthase
MFTGIITDIGLITSLIQNGDLRAEIATNYNTSTIDIGASIACCGVCLTVVEKKQNSFTVDISAETISCTNVGKWEVGTKINLERALKLGDELGGHIVSGHIDGLAEVLGIKPIGDSREIIFAAPDDLKFFIAAKGSVTLDGISLTVNAVNDNQFTVNIIPHTWENTTFGNLNIGTKVNLEIDTMARYVARLCSAGLEGVKAIESRTMINLSDSGLMLPPSSTNIEK